MELPRSSLIWLILNTVLLTPIAASVSPVQHPFETIAQHSTTASSPVCVACNGKYTLADPERKLTNPRSMRVNTQLQTSALVHVASETQANLSVVPLYINLQRSNRAVLEVTNDLQEELVITKVQVNDSQVHVRPLQIAEGLACRESVDITIEIITATVPFSAEVFIYTSAGRVEVSVVVDTGEPQLLVDGLPLKTHLIDLGAVGRGTYHYRQLEIFNPNSYGIALQIRSRNDRIQVSRDNVAMQLAPHTGTTFEVGIQVDGMIGVPVTEEAILVMLERSSISINVSAQPVSGELSAKYVTISEFPESASEGGAKYVAFSMISTLLKEINVYEISVEDQGYRFALSTLVSTIPAEASWLPVAELGFEKLIPSLFVQGELPKEASEVEVRKMQVRNSMWMNFRRRKKNLVNSTLSVLTDVMGSIHLPFSVQLTQPSVFVGGQVDLPIDLGNAPIGACKRAFIRLKNPSSRFPLRFKLSTDFLTVSPFDVEVPITDASLLLQPLETISIPVSFVAAEHCSVGCHGVLYVLNNLTRIQKVTLRGASAVPSMRLVTGNHTERELTSEELCLGSNIAVACAWLGALSHGLWPTSSPMGIVVKFTVSHENHRWTRQNRQEVFRKVVMLQNDGGTHLNVSKVVATGSRRIDAQLSEQVIIPGANSSLLLDVYEREASKASIQSLSIEFTSGFVFSFYLKLESESYRSTTSGIVPGIVVGFCVLFGSLKMGSSLHDTEPDHRGIDREVASTVLKETRRKAESSRLRAIPGTNCSGGEPQEQIKEVGKRLEVGAISHTAQFPRASQKVVYAEELERELQSIYGGSGSEGSKEVCSAEDLEHILKLPKPESVPGEPLPPPASELDLWKNAQDKTWKDVVERCSNNHLSCFIVDPLDFLRD